MKQPTAVKVGQVWVDKDIRAKYDEFTVLSVSEDGMYATVQRGPRKVRIRCDRMLVDQHGRGYRYIGMQR